MDGGRLAEAEEGGDGENGCELHIDLLARLDSAKGDGRLDVQFALVLYRGQQFAVYSV